MALRVIHIPQRGEVRHVAERERAVHLDAMADTLVSLWTEVRRQLEAAGVERPVFDARLLIEAGAGISRHDIITDPRRVLRAHQAETVRALASRRAAREPVAYILGRQGFWSFDLLVSPDVLIPRPETEFVVEAALAAIAPQAPARVIDLGVGSGAIVLAILSERPNATAVGIDRSEQAIALARANAERLGLGQRLELRRGDWWEGVVENFDVVVSNPPYIAEAEFAGLAPEVARYEPRLALEGGRDGLDAVRAILAGLAAHLRPAGVYAIEIGAGQGEAVVSLARDAGLSTARVVDDLAGHPRVVTGRAIA